MKRSSIKEVEYFEDMLLAEGDRLVKEGDYTRAFERFLLVKARDPNWKGLDERVNNLLFEEGSAALVERQPPGAPAPERSARPEARLSGPGRPTGRPMNCVIALKVVCCEPVAVSPEACARPPAVSAPKASGMLPLLLKKLLSALPTDLLISAQCRRKRRNSG